MSDESTKQMRRIATAVAASFVIVPIITLPFRAEILAAVPFRPPLWAVPGMVVTSIMLFVVWAWLWQTLPEVSGDV
jgi:protein-S-isoprenylcysteine O-methyltransferase Ste14